MGKKVEVSGPNDHDRHTMHQSCENPTAPFFNEMNEKRGLYTQKNVGKVICDDGYVIFCLTNQISRLAKQIAQLKVFFHTRIATLCRWKSNFTPKNGIFTPETVIVHMDRVNRSALWVNCIALRQIDLEFQRHFEEIGRTRRLSANAASSQRANFMPKSTFGLRARVDTSRRLMSERKELFDSLFRIARARDGSVSGSFTALIEVEVSNRAFILRSAILLQI